MKFNLFSYQDEVIKAISLFQSMFKFPCFVDTLGNKANIQY